MLLWTYVSIFNFSEAVVSFKPLLYFLLYLLLTTHNMKSVSRAFIILDPGYYRNFKPFDSEQEWVLHGGTKTSSIIWWVKKDFPTYLFIILSISHAFNICRYWLRVGDTQNLGWCEGWYSYFLWREGSGIYYRILMKFMLIGRFVTYASFIVSPLSCFYSTTCSIGVCRQ